MSWDPGWDHFYRWRSLRRYPSEELVRFAARHFYSAPDRRAVTMLDLGCGEGANALYLAHEGFGVSAVDGSPVAVEIARDRFEAEGQNADLQVGDLTGIDELYAPESFDAVVDVSSVQHNALPAAAKIIDGVFRVLKPGGWFFSTLIASGSTGEGTGREVESGTFTEMPIDQWQLMGVTHFYRLDELERLLARFDDVEINESSRTTDGRTRRYLRWIVEARKPPR